MLFVLGLAATVLTLVGAVLGIRTETKIKNGKLTKEGWGLLTVTAILGVVSIVSLVVKHIEDGKHAIQVENEKKDLNKQLAANKAALDGANAELVGARADLKKQLTMSYSLSRDLERERTPMVNPWIRWLVWVRPRGACLTEYIQKSSAVEQQVEEQGELREAPLLPLLSSECQSAMQRFFREFHLRGYAFRSDIPWPEVWRGIEPGSWSGGPTVLGQSWWFDAVPTSPGFERFAWDATTGRAFFYVESSLPGEALRNEDGSRVSALDLSEATMGLIATLDPLSGESLFGVQCVSFAFNGQMYSFGSHGCFSVPRPYVTMKEPGHGSLETMDVNWGPQALYTVRFPRISR